MFHMPPKDVIEGDLGFWYGKVCLLKINSNEQFSFQIFAGVNTYNYHRELWKQLEEMNIVEPFSWI